MNEQEIQHALDEMTKRHGPSKHMLDIQQFHQTHCRTVLFRWGRFVAQYEMFFDLITDLVTGINYIPKDKWPSHRGIQFVLCANNLRFFYSSFHCLTDGLTAESIVLSRPIFEAFIRIVYGSCYPSKADAVLAPVKTTDGTKFRLTSFMRDTLVLNWRTYNVWSSVTHSNTLAVFNDLESVRKRENRLITMRLSYDEDQFTAAMNLLFFVGIAFLRIVPLLFVTSYNENLKREDIEKVGRLADLWSAAQKLHPKAHWPQVMADIDYVLDIMKTAESGGDWNALVERRKEEQKKGSSK